MKIHNLLVLLCQEVELYQSEAFADDYTETVASLHDLIAETNTGKQSAFGFVTEIDLEKLVRFMKDQPESDINNQLIDVINGRLDYLNSI